MRSWIAALALAGCGSHSAPPLPLERDYPAPNDVSLSLERVERDGLDAIRVVREGEFTLEVEGAAEVEGELILPRQTGELTIRVTLPDGREGATTALVFGEVGDLWGVPIAQPGPYVNTRGWEDGAALSPDGETLFAHVVPISISGFLNGDPDHPWARQARGPFDAPRRPGFPRNRIGDDGSVRHGFALYDAWDLDFPFPPTALMAFPREGGIYGPPTVIGPIDDGDGSLGAFGVHQPTGLGEGWLVLSFDGPTTHGEADTVSDPYALPFDESAPTSYGRFFRRDGQILAEDWDPVRLGPTSKAHEGNPHLHLTHDGGSLWVDDETLAEKDLRVSVLQGALDVGSWSPYVALPEPINEPGIEEIQPFFDGVALTVRKDNALVTFDYLGGAYSRSSSWSEGQSDLFPDRTTGEGRIVVVGEPSIAVRDGVRVLSFVYGVMASDGTVDLNIGEVSARPGQ